MEGIFAKPDKKDDDEIIRMSSAKPSADSLRSTLLKAALIESLPASIKSSVTRLATRVEAWQKSPVLLIGPDIELR